MKEIIVIGAGNHSKVVLDILNINKQNVLALLDDNERLIGSKIFDIPIIGKTSLLNRLLPDKYELIISVGDPKVRKYLYMKTKTMGFSFANAIHPDAIISPRAEYGEGIIINAGVVIHPDVTLRDNILIGMNATISHDVIINSHVHISPGVHLTGECYIGHTVEIGTGAVVLPGISIGENSIIGAGAVVTKDIRSNVTAVGVPAKIIKEHD